MKIFRITNDVDQYRYFLPEDEADVLRFLNLNCTPMAEEWSPPSVRIFKPRHKVGNFYNFDSN
jgi:hypothetical protein